MIMQGVGNKHGERLRLRVPDNPGEGRLFAYPNNDPSNTIISLNENDDDESTLVSLPRIRGGSQIRRRRTQKVVVVVVVVSKFPF
jgi:hypothetical protein